MGLWFRTHRKPDDPDAVYEAMNPNQPSRYSFLVLPGDGEKTNRVGRRQGLDSMVSFKESLPLSVGKRAGIPRRRSVRLDLTPQV